MTKLNWKPGTLLAPVPPALISSGTVEKPNVMTAAWTGILNSDPPMTYVSIRPSRYSHEIISKTKEFVINLPTLELAAITDWCGVKSGRLVDKFKETRLTAEACLHVKAPMISQAPLSLECKVIDIRSFPTHDVFLAEILGVNVDEKYVDKNGRLSLEKAGLLAYVHGFYYTLGRSIGKFGFSVEGKKPAPFFVPQEDKKAAQKFSQKSFKCFKKRPLKTDKK